MTFPSVQLNAKTVTRTVMLFELYIFCIIKTYYDYFSIIAIVVPWRVMAMDQCQLKKKNTYICIVHDILFASHEDELHDAQPTDDFIRIAITIIIINPTDDETRKSSDFVPDFSCHIYRFMDLV